jgi:hypothetical protein
MTEHDAMLNSCLAGIKGDYRELPGLRLTKPQVRRIWALDDADCDVVLNALQASHFLRLTPCGLYVLADAEPDWLVCATRVH